MKELKNLTLFLLLLASSGCADDNNDKKSGNEEVGVDLAKRDTENRLSKFITGKKFVPVSAKNSTLIEETFGKDGRWSGVFSGFDLNTVKGNYTVQDDSLGSGVICINFDVAISKNQPLTSCRKAFVFRNGEMQITRLNSKESSYLVVSVHPTR